MTTLVTTRNLARPDTAYALLISAHEGLSHDESNDLNAQLILTLVNHIGDENVLREAIELCARTRHRIETPRET